MILSGYLVDIMIFPAARYVLTTFLLCAGEVTSRRWEKREGYGLKERHHVPRAWERAGPAPEEHMIQLQIGLRQGQFSELERHLYEGIKR